MHLIKYARRDAGRARPLSASGAAAIFTLPRPSLIGRKSDCGETAVDKISATEQLGTEFVDVINRHLDLSRGEVFGALIGAIGCVVVSIPDRADRKSAAKQIKETVRTVVNEAIDRPKPHLH
jgi:hypothetical protein